MIENKTTFNQFISMASAAPHVIVLQQLAMNISPADCLAKISQNNSAAALIDFKPDESTHYSFLGIEPITELKASRSQNNEEDPFAQLRQIQLQLNIADHHPATRFIGGAIGYMSYDAIRYIEAIPDRHANTLQLPDIHFKYYGTGIYFDHIKQLIFIMTLVKAGHDNLQNAYDKSIEKLNQLAQIISQPLPPLPEKSVNSSKPNHAFKPDLDDDAYAAMVKKAKAHIAKGDIFQIVPSRTFSKDFHGDAMAIYRSLKEVSPSPYHFYIQEKNSIILGASPETIVTVRDRIMKTTPLAGTRPRHTGRDEEEVAHELLNDPKEIAEHMMLVDLARNDIGSVAEPGSVKVSRLKYITKMSHVMHLASDVCGEIKKECDAIDALKANFPAGTLSGAPKIRAMQLIDEIEHSRRGIYGGAIVAFDRYSNLDSCIIIRSALIKNKKIYIRAGAGVVHDSDPYKEADETRHKARGIINAILLAEQGAPA